MAGREFAALRELARAKQLGQEPNGKYWSWTRWSAVYIDWSRDYIKRCIKEWEINSKNSDDGFEKAISHPANVYKIRS
jgi:hypothetical protein